MAGFVTGEAAYSRRVIHRNSSNSALCRTHSGCAGPACQVACRLYPVKNGFHDALTRRLMDGRYVGRKDPVIKFGEVFIGTIVHSVNCRPHHRCIIEIPKSFLKCARQLDHHCRSLNANFRFQPINKVKLWHSCKPWFRITIAVCFACRQPFSVSTNLSSGQYIYVWSAMF